MLQFFFVKILQAVWLGFVHIQKIGPVTFNIMEQKIVQHCETHMEVQACRTMSNQKHTKHMYKDNYKNQHQHFLHMYHKNKQKQTLVEKTAPAQYAPFLYPFMNVSII